MRREVNQACKFYLKYRYSHLETGEYNNIKKKLKKQLREATDERQDQFVEDVRQKLINSSIPVSF